MFSARRAKSYSGADGKTTGERLRACYYSMVNLQGTREVEAIDPRGRAGFITLQLVDLFSL
jgi:hypothetical protein